MVELTRRAGSVVGNRHERKGPLNGLGITSSNLPCIRAKKWCWKHRILYCMRLNMIIISLWMFVILTARVRTRFSLTFIQLERRYPTSTILAKGSLTCKYNGNCPVGSVCQPVTTGNKCQPYVGEQMGTISHMQPRRFQTCVQKCLEELKWDELYFYEHEPSPVDTYRALHGQGCVVEYQRIRSTVDKANWTVSLDEWMMNRNHHVIRVDPYIPTYNITNASFWRALCDDPCQDQNDCDGGFICTSRDGRLKTCQTSITRNEANHHDMVIVTAADSEYFRSLENLAGSMLYWGPEYRLVVYNLGMTRNQLDAILTWSNLLDLRWAEGIPTIYPGHVRRNLKNYAWKPIIINETVHEFTSIFWLDSGSTFVGRIEPIEFILHRHGVWLGQGQDNPMYHLSHTGTYEWFGRDKETFGWRPHFAGSMEGFMFPSRYIDTIVLPMAECALNESCIAPPGSNLKNHRYDQTVLSILAHHEHVQAPHYTEYFTFVRRLIPADLRRPSRYVIWTARRACSFYSYMIKSPRKLQNIT